MNARPVISLLTDFGLDDTYAGQMKGVIAGICPEAVIVDLTHAVRPRDVRRAAFLLAGSFEAFPSGTVHVAVVDPGVGGTRRIVCACVAGMSFLAPDNGLLSLVLEEHPPEAVYEVKAREFFREPVAPTFHGRDVFAPVAAHLAAGLPPGKLGPPARGLVTLELPKAKRTAEGTITGEVIYIDRFGNAVTSIRKSDLRGPPRQWRVIVRGREITGLSGTYADRPRGEALALIGSFGRLEVAVACGSASAALGIGEGDAVSAEPCGP